MHRMRRYAGSLMAATLIFAACSSDDDGGSADTAAPPAGSEAPGDTEAPDDTVQVVQSDGSKLDAVKSAGTVKCGTRDALPGFAVLQPDGSHVGFDSDFCRVIAAAVVGDAEAVDHVDLETADRFTALQSGEVDVLVRNTTWTAQRDGTEGATFLTTTYYDGQGMMVSADSGYASTSDMDGVIVCVAQGTTTEGNAKSEATRLGVDWEVRSFDTNELIQEAFTSGQCDGWSSDTSQLVAIRSEFPGGPELVSILPEVFSKEPLAPLVADGDTSWAQAVNWAILATIQAEEFGITSANVDEFLTSDNESILKFLGQPAGEDGAVLDPGLGLPTDFAYQVIKQVGNYGEIFDRHLTPLGLERGINALWFDGGLLYSPPYR